MKLRPFASLPSLRNAVAGLGREEMVLLLTVLAIAFGLRVWGAYFGLPHVYHPDEGFEVYRALRLGMGGFDFERVAKGGYYFILFVEYAFYLVGLFLTGAVTSVGEFAVRFVTDPSPFWKIGRVTTALLGTATAGAVWWQGRRIAGSRAGLLGAFFLAFSYRHVVDSHYITVDVPMTLFAFLAVVLVVEDVCGRMRLRTWPFAVVAAFAVLCKLPAIVIFVPYVLGAWMRGGFRGRRGIFTRATVVPAVLAGVLYCVANPGFVMNLAGMFQLVGDTVGGGGDQLGQYSGVEQRTNLWAYYAAALRQSQGPALFALGILGALIGAVKRSRSTILHLAFLVPFFVLIAGASSAHLYYFRYIVPLLPGLCLLAGLGLDELIRRIRLRRTAGTVAAVVVGALIVVEPGIAIVEWNRQHCRTDTRTRAVEWVETNLPHRTRILLEGFPEADAQLSVPLRNTRRNVKEMIERLRPTDPGKAKFWELRVEVLENPLYDLVTVRHFEPWGTLADYRAAGVEYAILRSDAFVPGRRRAAKLDPGTVGSRYAFYEALLSSAAATLVATFEGGEDGSPGPDLQIWKLGEAPAPVPAPGPGPGEADGERAVVAGEDPS
jgi:hypothetical protein